MVLSCDSANRADYFVVVVTTV